MLRPGLWLCSRHVCIYTCIIIIIIIIIQGTTSDECGARDRKVPHTSSGATVSLLALYAPSRNEIFALAWIKTTVMPQRTNYGSRSRTAVSFAVYSSLVSPHLSLFFLSISVPRLPIPLNVHHYIFLSSSFSLYISVFSRSPRLVQSCLFSLPFATLHPLSLIRQLYRALGSTLFCLPAN